MVLPAIIYTAKRYKTVKNVIRGLAVLLALAGIVWIGQGLNFIKGSFMTGSAFWAWTGLISLLVGVALLVMTFRTTSRNP